MSQPIAVLEKAFLVLETVDKLGRTATLKELTEATGLPKPTLYRILQTLVDLGYVDQDSARSRYGLSLRLRQLARGGDDFEDLRQKMLPVMENLHRKFNETINLGVLQLNHVYYVHFIETTQNLRWQVRPGSRDPFYCTALGRAVVAHLPEKQRKQLLNRIVFEQRTPSTPTNREEVERLLAETEERGWAYDDQENDLGVSCFGVPLFDPDGEVIASLSISVPQSRLTPDLRDEIISALLAVRHAALGSESSAVEGVPT